MRKRTTEKMIRLILGGNLHRRLDLHRTNPPSQSLRKAERQPPPARCPSHQAAILKRIKTRQRAMLHADPALKRATTKTRELVASPNHRLLQHPPSVPPLGLATVSGLTMTLTIHQPSTQWNPKPIHRVARSSQQAKRPTHGWMNKNYLEAGLRSPPKNKKSKIQTKRIQTKRVIEVR
jgi:hypothetical protein